MKPGNYTQMYVHLIFAVKYREALLYPEIRNRIFEYMGGIISSQKHKSIIINGVSDHVHILMGLNPSVSVSDTVHDIKRGSSIFINEMHLCNRRFAWQEGYGGFTYSRSAIDNVYNYIKNQEKHHEKATFKNEYIQTLKRFDVDYNERYMFNFLDIP